jgi:hypothetical protein
MIRARFLATVWLAAAALAACDSPSTPVDAGAVDSGLPDSGLPPEGLEIRPGSGIGPVTVGMRYSEVVAELGPMEGAFVNNRLGFGRYRELGLELVLVSADDGAVSDDAIVIGVGALESTGFRGPIVPGMSREALVAALGEPDDEAGESDYYLEGLSVEYDGDTVLKVGVFRPYTHASTPPEMVPASTMMEAP